MFKEVLKEFIEELNALAEKYEETGLMDTAKRVRSLAEHYSEGIETIGEEEARRRLASLITDIMLLDYLAPLRRILNIPSVREIVKQVEVEIAKRKKEKEIKRRIETV